MALLPHPVDALTSPAAEPLSEPPADIPAPPAETPPTVVNPPTRLASLDAYRGLVMFLMMAEVLKFCNVSKALPTSKLWQVLCFHQSHVEWVGCSLHDMIQPSFSFLVGVALPFSMASRAARGRSFSFLLGHAIWRALLLIFLGIFLRSQYGSQTEWGFEDTLSQIGLGYVWLFLLGFAPLRDHLIALGFILAVFWAVFASFPLPAAGFDYNQVGVTPGWLHDYGLNGFAAHWQKNSNPTWAFDSSFLNLFPRAKGFVFNRGGYGTLSFIPTLGTMILGLIAGNVLRSPQATSRKILWLLITGGVLMAGGWALNTWGICPIVKRIWTPSWVLYSGGACFLYLTFFYVVMEVGGFRRWAFPLTVIGMNSIAAYLISHLFKSFINKNLDIHFGWIFRAINPAYETLLHGGCVLLVMWLLLLWLYRRQVFLRV